GRAAPSQQASATEPDLPTHFDDSNGNGETCLVVLGESSAEGLPFDNWMSLGKIVAWKLQEAIPGRRFHAEVLAHRGDTLEMQCARLAGLRHRPDAVIVYAGHNEFSARYSWARPVEYYRDERSLATASGLSLRAARISPLCALIER